MTREFLDVRFPPIADITSNDRRTLVTSLKTRFRSELSDAYQRRGVCNAKLCDILRDDGLLEDFGFATFGDCMEAAKNGEL